jgi:hypothetical protein
MKFSILGGIILILGLQFSCTKSTEKEETTAEQPQISADSLNILAQEWLETNIETYFKKTPEDFKYLCTPEYYEYKSDAIQVGYDGGLEDEAFIKKWSPKFNTKLSGMGLGFMISGQDFGKIQVTSVTPTDTSLFYNVVIDDVAFRTTYHRKIKLVPAENSFLIADIEEID